ncbi:hypothetical protein GCM10011428_84970 [Streptomyces violaceus]
MARGKLRIYLGAAPGVGKTYAMLSEAHRRVERGTDCVVAFVEHYDRPRTEVMLHGLEQVPRRTLEYRGGVFPEMDLDAVLDRRPQIALVDELAHTNVPGSPQRQALAGRGGAAGGGHRRDLDRQHPAPGVPRRRRRVDHRGPARSPVAGPR